MLKDHKGNDTMSTQDIIRAHVGEYHGEKGNWQEVYAQLHKLVENPKYRIMRSGNTLFLYCNNGNKTATVRIFNAEKTKAIVENIKEFFNAIKKSGFNQVYVESQSPATVKLLEKTGFSSVTIMVDQTDQGGGKKYYTHVEL